MAIITKPVGGILKGVPATITLNKSELSALASVSADSYFSVTTNWNKIILNYKSSEGNQQEIVEFNATLSSPTGFFDVSLKARDLFEIQVIKIIDFDGDIFIIPRSELTTSDFDVEFLNPPSNLSYTTPVTYTQNETITNNVPSVIGTVNSYSISPALPTGLTINPTTGVISGTPTVAVAAANYTVTASNSGGPTTATINITVESAEVPVTGDYISWGNNNNYLLELDGGSTTTIIRSQGGTYNYVFAKEESWQTGDFVIEYEVSQNSTPYCVFGLLDNNTIPQYTTGFAGNGQIYFVQSVIGSWVKPLGDTYKLKIERIGFEVKFYVNDVLVASGTQTQQNFAYVKIPAFTMQPNVYIVKTTISV